MSIFDYYFLFLAKISTASLLLMIILAGISRSKKGSISQPEAMIINTKNLKYYQSICNELKLPYFKHKKKMFKQEEKAVKTLSKHLYIIDFKGDIPASGVEALTAEVNLILALANKEDAVLLTIESRGGTVVGYGLVASQINRLRQAGLNITIAIDQIAASGGYLVASLAHHIIAAPFACIGSIGVAYELPNMNKLLKKHGIEYTQITAGRYKRTLSLFGKNTPEGAQKAQESVEETHLLFQNYVSKYRDLDIDTVATGETWPAAIALEKGLIDAVMTSDEFILSQKDMVLIKISTPEKHHFIKTLQKKAVAVLQHLEQS